MQASIGKGGRPYEAVTQQGGNADKGKTFGFFSSKRKCDSEELINALASANSKQPTIDR